MSPGCALNGPCLHLAKSCGRAGAKVGVLVNTCKKGALIGT